MNVVRATPPRPLDVTAVFPQLAPPARTATRLHPTWHDSTWLEGPVALLPLAQLYVRDIPLLRPPPLVAGFVLREPPVRRPRLEGRRLAHVGLHRPRSPALPRVRHRDGPAADH